MAEDAEYVVTKSDGSQVIRHGDGSPDTPISSDRGSGGSSSSSSGSSSRSSSSDLDEARAAFKEEYGYNPRTTMELKEAKGMVSGSSSGGSSSSPTAPAARVPLTAVQVQQYNALAAQQSSYVPLEQDAQGNYYYPRGSEKEAYQAQEAANLAMGYGMTSTTTSDKYVSPEQARLKTTSIINDVVSEGWATYRETPTGFVLQLTPAGQEMKGVFVPALVSNLPEGWQLQGSSAMLVYSGKPTTITKTKSNELLNPAWRVENAQSLGGSGGSFVPSAQGGDNPLFSMAPFAVSRQPISQNSLKDTGTETPYETLRRQEAERNVFLEGMFSFGKDIVEGGNRALTGRLYREGSWAQDSSKSAVSSFFSLPQMALGIGGKALDIWQYKSSLNEEKNLAATRMATEDISGVGTLLAFGAVSFYASSKQDPIGTAIGIAHWWTTELIPMAAVGGLYMETAGVIGKEVSMRLPTKVTSESYSEVQLEYETPGGKVTAGRTTAVSRAEGPLYKGDIIEYKGEFSQTSLGYEAKNLEGGFEIQAAGQTKGIVSIGKQSTTIEGQYFLGPSVERPAVMSIAETKGLGPVAYFSPANEIAPAGVYTKFLSTSVIQTPQGPMAAISKGVVRDLEFNGVNLYPKPYYASAVVRDLAEFNGVNFYQPYYASAGYGGPTVGTGYMAVYNPFADSAAKLSGLEIGSGVSAGSSGGGGLVMVESAALQAGFKGVQGITPITESLAIQNVVAQSGVIGGQLGASAASLVMVPSIAGSIIQKPMQVSISAPSQVSKPISVSVLKPQALIETKPISVSVLKPQALIETKPITNTFTLQTTKTGVIPFIKPLIGMAQVPVARVKESAVQIEKLDSSTRPMQITPPTQGIGVKQIVGQPQAAQQVFKTTGTPGGKGAEVPITPPSNRSFLHA
jgi:hypothetical protein